MASWMVRRGAKIIGPFSTKVIQVKAKQGQLLPNDQVKQVGQRDWRAAASIRGLFSAEAIQLAASADSKGNDIANEQIPEALHVNTQSVNAVIPEALPANNPSPPDFQKKNFNGHNNMKKKLIAVSLSVGGIVLIVAIALVITFNLPNSKTDDIIPVEPDAEKTVIIDERNAPQTEEPNPNKPVNDLNPVNSEEKKLIETDDSESNINNDNDPFSSQEKDSKDDNAIINSQDQLMSSSEEQIEDADIKGSAEERKILEARQEERKKIIQDPDAFLHNIANIEAVSQGNVKYNFDEEFPDISLMDNIQKTEYALQVAEIFWEGENIGTTKLHPLLSWFADKTGRAHRAVQRLKLKEAEIQEKQTQWGITGVLAFEKLSDSQLETLENIKREEIAIASEELTDAEATLNKLRREQADTRQIEYQLSLRKKLKTKLGAMKRAGIEAVYQDLQSQLYKMFNEAIQLAEVREPLSRYFILEEPKFKAGEVPYFKEVQETKN